MHLSFRATQWGHCIAFSKHGMGRCLLPLLSTTSFPLKMCVVLWEVHCVFCKELRLVYYADLSIVGVQLCWHQKFSWLFVDGLGVSGQVCWTNLKYQHAWNLLCFLGQESLGQVTIWCIGEYGEMLVDHLNEVEGEEPLTVSSGSYPVLFFMSQMSPLSWVLKRLFGSSANGFKLYSLSS